ncbi:MAG: glucose 1-dehydrogenase [Bacteroidota bacterium]|nr:glucose 1-dehydrogenase [Bacteroidota bacterium]
MGHAGKVVIVTGAGRGIGRCVAEMYAAEGARVVLAERDAAAGEAAETEIRGRGGDACFVLTDVSVPGQVSAMVRKAVERYGAVDIVINNAGFGIWKSPLDLTEGEWDSVLDTNLRGAFLCAREAARCMKEQGGGSVINIASTRAFMSEAGSEAYAASKGGLVALTHALAASLAQYHIRVNCISPGWIETGDYEALREADHSQHLSGRVGRPEDIARACLFLTGDGNEFINGENIVIDGGMTRKMIYLP